MFKLLNRKNKMKELECRIAALESNVTTLNAKEEIINKSQEDTQKMFKSSTTYIDNGFIKGAVVSGRCECNCGNNDREKVIPFDSNGDLILQIDGEVIGKIALNQLRKDDKQCLN